MRTVYFIKPVGMCGPIKIGCSVSPDGRRKALESWSPFPLEIIAEIEGDFFLERRFHALFKAHHQRHEWFSPSDEIEAVVEAINKGCFDCNTLPEPICIKNRDAGQKRKRTPEQCRQFSFSQRAWRTADASGWRAPVTIFGIIERNDPAEIALAEQYFSAPDSCGIPMASPKAEKRRAEYLIAQARSQARAA